VRDASQDISPFLTPPLEHPRRHHLVVTQGGDEGDRLILQPGRGPSPASPEDPRQLRPGYGGSRRFRSRLPSESSGAFHRSGDARRARLTVERGRGRLAIRKHASCARQLQRAPMSGLGTDQPPFPGRRKLLRRARLGLEKTVRLSVPTGKAQSSSPWSWRRTFSDCHNFGAYPQCLAE
jgi:hypothetical protein